MKIRKLLICTEPSDEVEKNLKEVYLRRVQEMFRKAISLESTLNVFDEVFHGLMRTSLNESNLYDFYESLLTITSYYQHSQAGRGSLIARLLGKLGNPEKMEFEFVLGNLPRFLESDINLESLEHRELLKTKFDVVSKTQCNLAFCELKMKVYSGCTAGRIEMINKFIRLTQLIIKDQSFRDCIKSAYIENIFLIGGILFDVQGRPATLEKDKKWGLCYNGLLRSKEDLIETLKASNIGYRVEEGNSQEIAFSIKFEIDDLKVNIIIAYGNEVIRNLFAEKRAVKKIEYFEAQLGDISYDDLWLSQIIAISERTILNRNFRKANKLWNNVISILTNEKALLCIKRFVQKRNQEVLEKVVDDIIRNIDVPSTKPIPAEVIISSLVSDYNTRDYIADIVQFLSCQDVVDSLKLCLI